MSAKSAWRSSLARTTARPTVLLAVEPVRAPIKSRREALACVSPARAAKRAHAANLGGDSVGVIV